jgi:hypothetical protein
MKRVITHAGAHHADELLAIATLEFATDKKFQFQIERTFQVSQEDLDNPEVFVLDIGRQYNPEMGNFDHHQSGDLKATNILILESLCGGIELVQELKTLMFDYVSDIDRGVKFKTPGLPCLNSMVKGLSFDEALDLVRLTLKSAVSTARERIKSREEIKKCPIEGNVLLTHQPIVGWQDLVDEHIIYCLGPNPRGGWSLVSKDSTKWPIPVAEGQTFRHNSGFMAVYESREAALDSSALV